MKTATVTINNRQYMLVYNLAVMIQMEEAGIVLEQMSSDPKKITHLTQMMVFAINQGAAYAAASHLGDYPTTTLAEFSAQCEPADFNKFDAVLADLIVGDRQVDAAPPKSAGAAEAAAAPGN